MHLQVLELITLLIILSALFLFINTRFIKLPSTIGLMLLAIGLSFIVVIGGLIFPQIHLFAKSIFIDYKFSDVLFNVMLSFMLFAGAMEINLKKLGEEKWAVFILAIIGTLISTFVVGFGIFFLLPLVGYPIDFIYCLLFGALISPTDPISVLAMIKHTTVSKNLQIQIAGESLFNDGVGVVIFLTILHVITGGVENFSIGGTALLFGQEVAGGLLLGVAFGWVGLKLLMYIDNKYTEIEVLVTLAMVMGCTILANKMHVSAPLAIVAMGIFVGKEGRHEKLANATGEYVHKFWGLIDETLNAILFILIGLQAIIISWKIDFFLAAGVAIIIVLFARFVGVTIPISSMRLKRKFPKYTIRILTWSGLRGGISVALALSLYDLIGDKVDNSVTDMLIVMTYSVVFFSIVVQGLTIGKLFAKFKGD